MRARTAAIGLVVLVPTLALSACSPDEEPETVSTPSSVVVQPGKPGEPAKTVAPEDYEGAPEQAPFSRADAEFLSDMIWHHDQAIEMSVLAPERAASEQLKTFANRIDVVQASEIDLMTSWLEENDYPVPLTAEGGDGSGPRAPEHGHDAADMPGMLTDVEMAALEDASGQEFDRLYLEGMIKHHEGALAMCKEVAAAGSQERVLELANNIAADQMAEIDRLDQMLDEL
ncbi:Uncharacterized conserved protein, DUF305 family [Promicromonospora thailandica]|uniref:Uncharacterized conserved protein, DUF305 family n=2 Tax=Promicromonospora thailandica TaxID=765201 RepID=A0A9X2G8P8_9MICO|nr:Uncharacterized conserved protein, DUF305 family [Promicromonospora thailandica]